MLKQKKIPMRTCVACRTARPKRELIRIVHNKEGETFVDTTGKMNGRGAYICASVECLEKADKTKALNRALDIEFTEDMLFDAKKAILRREIDK